MHPTLEKQIKHYLGKHTVLSTEWRTLFRSISKTYRDFDEVRILVARLTKKNSKGITDKRQRLKTVKEKMEKLIQERTESLAKYQTLINNLSVGVYRNTPGPRGHFLEANPAMVSMFEAKSKAEFMKKNVSDLYQDPEKRGLFVKKLIKHGSVKNEELNLVTLKGRKIIASVSAVLVKSSDGAVYFDGLVEDITDRKRTERALKITYEKLESRVKERTKELSERVTDLENARIALNNVYEDLRVEKSKLELAQAKEEAILMSIGDGLVATDENGNIILINKAAENLLGIKAENVLGKYYFDAIDIQDELGASIPEEKRPIGIALARGISTITTISGPTLYYMRKNKTKFPVAIMAAPITLGGKVIGAIQISRDITREKEIDKAKTEFVSLASHQLRAPLTTISWYTEMILNGDVGAITSPQKKYLEKIYQGNRRMIELVNTLLDVSRIELGTFMVKPEPTDLVALAESVLNEQKLKIEERKLSVIQNLSKGIPLFPADPKLLRIVLQNILSNAIKYTPPNGKIEFDISLDDDKAILIRVADSGYGIPSNQQNKIFTKLFRADNVRQKDTEGNGLGLYIVKSVIEHSGGKIWFESPTIFTRTAAGNSDNYGTTFYVRIPLAGMQKKEGNRSFI